MKEYTERGHNIWKELVWKESGATMYDVLSDMSETSNDFYNNCTNFEIWNRAFIGVGVGLVS